MNDDQQNQGEQPETDAFSSFDPDDYLKKRSIDQGRYNPRPPPPTTETRAMRLRRSTAEMPQDLLGDASGLAESMVPDDAPETLGDILRDMRPVVRAGVLAFGCVAAVLIIGLCVINAVLLISLVAR